MAIESRRGTTLVELLVAVMFLAVCVSGIVACTASAQHNATYAGRRGLALAAATSEIERARADAAGASLVVGTGLPSPIDGIPSPSSCTRVVALVAGYTNLYLVTVTVAWTEHSSSGPDRNDSLTLVTQLRSPDG